MKQKRLNCKELREEYLSTLREDNKIILFTLGVMVLLIFLSIIEIKFPFSVGVAIIPAFVFSFLINKYFEVKEKIKENV